MYAIMPADKRQRNSYGAMINMLCNRYDYAQNKADVSYSLIAVALESMGGKLKIAKLYKEVQQIMADNDQ